MKKPKDSGYRNESDQQNGADRPGTTESKRFCKETDDSR